MRLQGVTGTAFYRVDVQVHSRYRVNVYMGLQGYTSSFAWIYKYILFLFICVEPAGRQAGTGTSTIHLWCLMGFRVTMPLVHVVGLQSFNSP